jgi:hypothetical protein
VAQDVTSRGRPLGMSLRAGYCPQGLAERSHDALLGAASERTTTKCRLEQPSSPRLTSPVCPANLLCIHALCVQGQVANLHVLDHATAKRAHRRLLCEMNSTTWRRETWSAVAAKRNPSNWESVERIKELPRSGLVQRPLRATRRTFRILSPGAADYRLIGPTISPERAEKGKTISSWQSRESRPRQ